MGYLKPVTSIFYSYVFSMNPIFIIFFSIILGIKFLPRLFSLILSLIKR